MKTGDRVGDWQIVAEAPGEPDVARFRAVDTRTGEPVELLTLRAAAPADHAAFAQLHRALTRAADPALARTLAADVTDGRAVVARQPLEDGTLADAGGPLDPGRVAAIGARLLPAVVAAGPATQGALTPRDVGMDAAGRPVLAPRGRPGSRIGAGDRKWAAPEAFDGAAPDAAAGLYGLGVMLYLLATGKDPLPPGAKGVAPSASSVRRGVPPALDRALALLLDPDPTKRAGALPLLQEAAGDLGDLRAAPRNPAQDEVRYTKTATPGASARPDLRPPPSHIERSPAAVVVPARALRRLDPALRSAAAGWAAVSQSTVDALADNGLPLVLDTARTPAEARRRGHELARDSGLPVDVAAPPGCTPWLVAAISSPVVPVAALLAWWFAFPVVAATLLSLGVLLAVTLGWWWLAARQHAAARAAFEIAWEERQVRLPELAGARERIAALRRRIATADLPGAASLDLRSALREVEEQLTALAREVRVADEALQRAEIDRLRTRLDGLVREGAAAERDRVARAVADLEEVERRKERALAEITRVDAALDEVDALLGRVSGRMLAEAADAGADALERLVKHTRLARETLVESSPAPRQRPRETE